MMKKVIILITLILISLVSIKAQKTNLEAYGAIGTSAIAQLGGYIDKHYKFDAYYMFVPTTDRGIETNNYGVVLTRNAWSHYSKFSSYLGFGPIYMETRIDNTVHHNFAFSAVGGCSYKLSDTVYLRGQALVMYTMINREPFRNGYLNNFNLPFHLNIGVAFRIN